MPVDAGDYVKIERAFEELRAFGYFAKQNFQCCQSCGCAAVPEEFAERYVFYHYQDAEDLERDGSCYLAWAGDFGLIERILHRNGIYTEHDGEPGTRIYIDTTREPEPPEPARIVSISMEDAQFLRRIAETVRGYPPPWPEEQTWGDFERELGRVTIRLIHAMGYAMPAYEVVKEQRREEAELDEFINEMLKEEQDDG